MDIQDVHEPILAAVLSISVVFVLTVTIAALDPFGSHHTKIGLWGLIGALIIVACAWGKIITPFIGYVITAFAVAVMICYLLVDLYHHRKAKASKVRRTDAKYFCLWTTEEEPLNQRFWRMVLQSSMMGVWQSGEEDGPAAAKASQKWMKGAKEMMATELEPEDIYKTLVCAVRPEKTDPSSLRIALALCVTKGPLSGDDGDSSMKIVKNLADTMTRVLSTGESEFLAKECCCFVCFKRTDEEKHLCHGVQLFFLDGLLCDDAEKTKNGRVSVAFPVCSEACVIKSIEEFDKAAGASVIRLGDDEEEEEVKGQESSGDEEKNLPETASPVSEGDE